MKLGSKTMAAIVATFIVWFLFFGLGLFLATALRLFGYGLTPAASGWASNPVALDYVMCASAASLLTAIEHVVWWLSTKEERRYRRLKNDYGDKEANSEDWW